MITPVRAERNITTAKEASNFQNKKERATGVEFWMENIATIKIIINASIIILI
jgi:hypothetical protein